MKYTLATFRTVKPDQPRCSCPELTPGLDGDTCAKCGLYWPRKGVRGKVRWEGLSTTGVEYSSNKQAKQRSLI